VLALSGDYLGFAGSTESGVPRLAMSLGVNSLGKWLTYSCSRAVMGQIGTVKVPRGQEIASREKRPESEGTGWPDLCRTRRHLPCHRQPQRHWQITDCVVAPPRYQSEAPGVVRTSGALSFDLTDRTVQVSEKI
jgi:hypothetical protein